VRFVNFCIVSDQLEIVEIHGFSAKHESSDQHWTYYIEYSSGGMLLINRISLSWRRSDLNNLVGLDYSFLASFIVYSFNRDINDSVFHYPNFSLFIGRFLIT
jgi:hypothetical protein